MVNAFVCPGLGSLMARRFSGVPQLALVGAVWMTVAMARYFQAYVRLMQAPPDGETYLYSGLAGLAVFLAGWVWSVFTGAWILWQAKPAAPVIVEKTDWEI